ncbi:hypothetical protein DB30_07096 [Enhygromyxa salina]|uniref:Uncharacterized protein n=1 Tax=Enhygromyxa salina TaxID=215803 RepID=A0A0C2CWV0_9BACT|nr:hypothetical protein [Enhygromyxa salina]KIG14100.1 hypothetical protein DB30_07096 [Enhygromyxa salina]
MTWLALALLLGPATPETVPVQRPGDPVTWVFEWRAPPACPGREQLIARIHEYLPQLEDPPEQAAHAMLRISAEVVVAGDTWQANVRVSGRDGDQARSFSAPSCTELADASALIAAVALDPVLAARSVALTLEPAPTSPPDPTPEPDPDPDPEPQRPRPEPPAGDSVPTTSIVISEPPPPPRNFQIGLRLQGHASYGPTTTGYAGIGGGLALFDGLWRWQLEGGWWTPRRVNLSDGRAGRFQAWWVGTRGCVVPSAGALEFPLCPGVEAGQVIGEGIEPTTNRSKARYAWVAGVLGQGLNWVITDRVALSTEATLLVPFTRGQFSIDEQALQAITPVGVRAMFGLEVRI